MSQSSCISGSRRQGGVDVYIAGVPLCLSYPPIQLPAQCLLPLNFLTRSSSTVWSEESPCQLEPGGSALGFFTSCFRATVSLAPGMFYERPAFLSSSALHLIIGSSPAQTWPSICLGPQRRACTPPAHSCLPLNCIVTVTLIFRASTQQFWKTGSTLKTGTMAGMTGVTVWIKATAVSRLQALFGSAPCCSCAHSLGMYSCLGWGSTGYIDRK